MPNSHLFNATTQSTPSRVGGVVVFAHTDFVDMLTDNLRSGTFTNEVTQ